MSNERTEREQEHYNTVLDAMSTLVNATNPMGSENIVAEAMYEALHRSHKTLQSNFMRSYIKAMSLYSASHTDLRNQGAVDMAKAITEIEIALPFI